MSYQYNIFDYIECNSFQKCLICKNSYKSGKYIFCKLTDMIIFKDEKNIHCINLKKGFEIK